MTTARDHEEGNDIKTSMSTIPILSRISLVPSVRIAWIGLLLAASPAWAESWRVTVRGRSTELGETPVVVEIKTPLPRGNYVVEPAGGGQGRGRSANIFEDAGKRYLGMVLDHVRASTTESYTLRPDDHPAPTSTGVELRAEGANLRVFVGGKLLTEYRTDDGPKPFYYPVYGPTGVSFTRSYPMKMVAGEDRDHPHQRSLWFTHGNVNGVDFWSEFPGCGSIKEVVRNTVAGGAAVGLIRTTDDWLGPDGKKVCEDERVAWFYATSTAHVIDFDVTLKATDGPVTLGDTKEGMFGVRVASSMDAKRKQGGKITNAEGLTNDDAWGKPSPWVDYAGPVEGQTVGIAILNHPESFRHPTTWHVRTYGLFAANPFGWRDFGLKEPGSHTIPPGGSIRFRYRVILHAGDTATAHLPAAFEAFAHPPVVEVRGE